MRHEERPKRAEGGLPDDVGAFLNGAVGNPYSTHIAALGTLLKGKIVKRSSGGRSGYALFFEDDSWVVCFLKDGRMDWRTGQGGPSPDVLTLLDSTESGDASRPLEMDLPNAREHCEIAAQTRNAHGKRVEGVAIGENSFSLCFPEGMELEGHVIPTQGGVMGLRVFWEPW